MRVAFAEVCAICMRSQAQCQKGLRYWTYVWDVLMGLWEGTKSPLTLGPRYIPTPAPDLIGAIGTAVAIALGPDVLHRLQTLCVQYVLRSQAQCQK